MKRFIIFCFLLITSLAGWAQSRVTGTVKDQKGHPLVGASLTLKDTYDGATSDSSGHFSFTTTEKGEKILAITAVGYKPVEQKIILAGAPQTLAFQLKEEISELTAVVITAGTFEASDRKRAAVVLNSIDVVTTAGANGDITGALKTLPGAQQVGEAEGLFVRGGTAAETKVFIDGTLVNRFYFSTAPDRAGYGRFNPFLFKGTVFSTGGYSALYGQALSSAVILESIDLPDQTSASIGVSVLGADAGYQYLNKKKTASWGLSYGYTDLRLAYAVLKQRQEYDTPPHFHDIEGNFRFKTSKTGMLKYYGMVNMSALRFTQPSLDSLGYRDYFGLENFYTYQNLAWKENLGKGWKVNAGISYTNNRDKIDGHMEGEDGKKAELTGLEFKSYKLEPTGHYGNTKLVLEKRMKNLNALRFGTEYNVSEDITSYTDAKNTNYRYSIHEKLAAFFAESDLYVTNALAAKVGVRAEHSAYFDKSSVAPRLSLAYKLGKESQASLAYGIFYQNPETKYLPAAAALDFMKATHYIAQYQKTSNLQVFRAEAFYKKYDNLLKTGMVNGRDGLANSNAGYGDAKGFEIFWRDKKTIKNLDYWFSYSYLDTKRDFLNFPYATRPNFAAKHTASLIIKKFVMPIKTGFNLAYNYASSRPFYHIAYDQPSAKYKFTDKGNIPDYNNLSFSLNYIPSIGKQNAKSWAVYVVSINNILNLKQTYGYQYSYNGYRRETIVPPSRMFVYIGAFFSFGIDRTDDAVNNNL